MEIKRILKILSVSFDELGLTDNKNPFGLISFLHPFIDLLSSGKSVRKQQTIKQTKRDNWKSI